MKRAFAGSNETLQSSTNFAIFLEKDEEEGGIENFDLTTMEDLKLFLTLVLKHREPFKLIEIASETANERDFQHKYALQYIK